MNDVQRNAMLDPIVDEMKTACHGSSDYLSGINDGSYAMGMMMLRKMEKAFIIAYMNRQEFHPSFVDEVCDGKLKAAWELFLKNFDNI